MKSGVAGILWLVLLGTGLAAAGGAGRGAGADGDAAGALLLVLKLLLRDAVTAQSSAGYLGSEVH